MFKIIALVGAIAGGTSYGLYAHTDLFGSHCGNCSLSAKKSCCNADSPALPPCCESGEDCCSPGAACCEIGSAISAGTTGSGAPSCCSAKTQPISAAKASCCANPCPACAVACDNCPICQVDCSGCCGLSAKAAVAGPAAALAGVVKK